MSLLLFAVDSIRLPSRFSKKIASANVQADLTIIFEVKTRYIVNKRHDTEFAIEVSYVDRGPLRLFNGTWSACHVPLTVLRGLELFPTEPLANYTLPPTLYRRNCRLNYLIRIGLRLLNQAGVKNLCCPTRPIT